METDINEDILLALRCRRVVLREKFTYKISKSVMLLLVTCFKHKQIILNYKLRDYIWYAKENLCYKDGL